MAYTTIDDPSAYFKVQLYVGNATTGKTVVFDDTDTNMSPNLIWIKNRDGADPHHVFDNVRSVGERIRTNQTDAASFVDASDDLQQVRSHDSDGFTLGDNTDVNGNTENFVAWCWKAGTTSGINTTGSDITPSAYSFNQTSGFSIVKYTGNQTSDTQVAHGLGAAPGLVIAKDLENGSDWVVYHHKNTSAPETDVLVLNATYATADHDDRWSDTAPTSVNFTVGSGDQANINNTLIAYCFAEKQGFSKFGSYTGNGNADGVFIYTGFRPAMIIVKVTDTAGDWRIFDTTRDTYNVADAIVYPSAANAEGTETFADFLSNGFKIRSSSNSYNGSGNTYVYMAFAEAPFVNSNGVPCNAR